jgi:hypothetical protein
LDMIRPIRYAGAVWFKLVRKRTDRIFLIFHGDYTIQIRGFRGGLDSALQQWVASKVL